MFHKPKRLARLKIRKVARRTRRRLVVTGVSLLVASVALPIAGALLFPPAAPGPIGAVSWISAFLMMGGVLCITQSHLSCSKSTISDVSPG